MECHALARLIRPIEPVTFLDQTWGRRSAVYAGAVADEANTLLTLSSFERLLATVPRAHDGWLHLVRGGLQPVPPDMVDSQGMLKLQKVRAAFAAGYTLYLTKAERVAYPLMQLARAIEVDLAAQGVGLRDVVSAHVFLTPPDAQGFALHRDEHASFVIQLGGSKEWTVYEPLPQPPASDGQAPRPGAVAPSSLEGANRYTYVLGPGDVAYIPEWWPHEARTGGAESLHVTLRLFPLRWRDLVLDLFADHPTLASALPTDSFEDPRELLTALLGLLDSPRFRQTVPALLNRWASARRSLASRSVLPDDGFRQIVGLNHIGLDTPLVRCAGVTCQLSDTDEGVSIEFPGGHVRGPAALRQVFAYLTRVTELRPQDLPAMPESEYDRLAVARMLVKEGLLRTASWA